MKNVIGCTLAKAKEMQIDKELWEEMEQLAAENPAGGAHASSMWGEKELFVLETYFPKVSARGVIEMLKKVNPDVDWNEEKVRGKARRLGIKKEKKQ